MSFCSIVKVSPRTSSTKAIGLLRYFECLGVGLARSIHSGLMRSAVRSSTAVREFTPLMISPTCLIASTFSLHSLHCYAKVEKLHSLLIQKLVVAGFQALSLS